MRTVAVLSFIVAITSDPYAQQSTFEVASVKLNTSGDSRSGYYTGTGRFTGTNVTLRSLIQYAFHVQDWQLVNAPDWAGRERYDVVAKTEGDVEDDVRRVMMQSLLAERFQIAVHRDTRELPIYALVLARNDQKPGPGLTKVETDCGADCGTSVNESSRAATLTARGATIQALATRLSDSVNRVVVDRTNLSGGFDITLNWTPDQSASTSGPSLFTAIQEQLGLKLESTRGPVDVVVVDRVERPTPD